jgi:DNA repair protein RecO (recombination protein O)
LEYGKLRLVAKGVRRPKSKKAGHLEPFTRVRLQNARGRELDVVTQAEAVELYTNIHEDLQCLSRAAVIGELVDRFSIEQETHRGVYRLLCDALERMNTEYEPATVQRYFEAGFLETVGYLPELFRCVLCSSEIRPEAQFFSFQEGGVVCPSCGSTHKGLRRISLPALKVLRHFQRSSFSAVAEVRIRESVHAELDDLMEGFFNYLLERNLRSPNFIRQVKEISGSYSESSE